MDAVVENMHPQWRSLPNSDSVINKTLLTGRRVPAYKKSPKKSLKPSQLTTTRLSLKRLRVTKRSLRLHTVTTKAHGSLEVQPEELPCDAVVFFGDLNYRLDLPRLEIERLHQRILRNTQDSKNNNHIALEGSLGEDPLLTAMKNKFDNRYFRHSPPHKALLEQQLDRVLLFDQLHQQRSRGAVLRNFQEGPIRFPPTYKYDEHAGSFDSSDKQRSPAWTDRILFSTRFVPARDDNSVDLGHPDALPQADAASSPNSSEGRGRAVLKLRDYYSINARTSDHRPVCTDFTLHL